jgi:hypothetical protein
VLWRPVAPLTGESFDPKLKPGAPVRWDVVERGLMGGATVVMNKVEMMLPALYGFVTFAATRYLNSILPNNKGLRKG